MSIIRGIICCEYIGDSFNGGLFQGGWILFDYIENMHLEYFSRELFQGSANIMLVGSILFHGGRILYEYIIQLLTNEALDIM